MPVKISMLQLYERYCIKYDWYKNEYSIISYDENTIILRHNVCGTIFTKTKNNYLKRYECNNSMCVNKKREQFNINKYGVKAVLQSERVKEKIKKTNLKKYGVENASQNKIIIQKRQDTCLKKFNSKYYINSEDAKSKIKVTNIERYGAETPLSNKDVRDKIKKTNLEKYGAECCLSNRAVREKIKNTFIEKYNAQSPLGNDDIKNKIKQTNIERYGVENPFQNVDIRRKTSISIIQATFLEKEQLFLDNNIQLLDDYSGIRNNAKNVYYKFRCLICNNEFEHYLANGNIPKCPKCFPPNFGTSNIEKEVQIWLSSQINIQNNKRFFDDNKYKYELDVFIEEKKIGIELNGLYWHSEVSGGKDRNYHLEKMKWFNRQGIQIIQIFDFEWIEKREIVKSIIKAKLGLTDRNIYARQCKVGIVDNKIANEFLMENHIQGRVPSNVKVGLFYGDELVSVLTFGKSRYNKKYEWEILRFCNALNTNVVGGFSKMLKFFTENYKPKSIITYADARFSDGGLYRKNGFTEMAFSKPNYFYTQKYDGLESRVKYQKHKLKDKLESFDPELTEWENMQMNGFDRVWDCGNFCFVVN
jgi:hypothetical protein